MSTIASSRWAAWLTLVAVLATTAGCTPRVVVRKNPDEHDRGIRYYRPKPYLKIEPAEVSIDRNATTLVPGMVRISLVYMPDFSEEYSINVRSGLGVADVGIELTDGWNLTEISQELDSQTDENVEAVGRVLTAVGGLVPTAADSGEGETTVSFTVPARNVPIGFYESVVGCDGCGVKRLYGFRYLGFLPFVGCPVEMGGHTHLSCWEAGCGLTEPGLYGLTFRGGEMVFESLHDMAIKPAVTSVAAKTETTARATDTAIDNDASAEPLWPPVRTLDAAQSATALRAFLVDRGQVIQAVQIAGSGGRRTIEVDVPDGQPVEPIRATIDDWLRTQGLDPSGVDVTFDTVR